MNTKMQLLKVKDWLEELKDLSVIRARMAVAFPPHQELYLYLKAQIIIDSRITQVLNNMNDLLGK